MYKYSADCHSSLLLKFGVIRIGTLHNYRGTEHRRGISDPDEGTKIVSHHIENLHILHSEDPNNELNKDFGALSAFRAIHVSNSRDVIIQNVRLTQRSDAADCFILCLSKFRSRKIMKQFEGADACVEIVEPERFFRLITNAIGVPVVFRGVHEITYQDRTEPWNGRDWGRHPALIKALTFRDQAEVRALWEPLQQSKISPANVVDYRIGECCKQVHC